MGRPNGQHPRQEAIALKDRIVNGAGTPVATATIELLQADAAINYNHPDRRRADKPRDAHFGGFGPVPTDAEGRFRVAVVNPGPVPGRGEELHTPQIKPAVVVRGLPTDLSQGIFFTGGLDSIVDPLLLSIHCEWVPPASPGGTGFEPTLSREPLLIGFDEELSDTAPPPTSAREASPAIALLASLAVHLWPLLFLLEWNGQPGEISPPIPVHLVMEQPAPEPAAVAHPAPTPLRGPLASDDLGETAPEPDKRKITATTRPTKPASAPSTGAPPRLAAANPSALKPQPLPPAARLPGPHATRDEYMAHCLSVVRRYHGMVPSSLLIGRTGRAVLSLLVLGDGRIARITLVQSSGFPNLDQRLEEMVATVRRFPPLPQWHQGPMLMTYEAVFAGGRLR